MREIPDQSNSEYRDFLLSFDQKCHDKRKKPSAKERKSSWQTKNALGRKQKSYFESKKLVQKRKAPGKKKIYTGSGKRKYIVTVENSCLLKKAKSAKSECFVFKNC